jgi:RHS repeat-associated protein
MVFSPCKDRAPRGGAVGSNTPVKIQPDAAIYGSVVSGGDVDLKNRVNIQAGTVTINYLEYPPEAPQGVARTVEWTIENYKAVLIASNSRIESQYKIMVTGIHIVSEGNNLDYSSDSVETYTVNPGQTLTLELRRELGELQSESYTGDRITALYDANALIMESIAFSEGVIKNNEDAWSYDFYLRDHLGSTRMVVADDDLVGGAFMYHPYGNIADVIIVGGNNPLREKFTGKEIDKEGATEGAGGAPGMGLAYFGRRYYDAEVGLWTSTDPTGQIFNPYGYSANPINTVDPNGEWIGALLTIGEWYLSNSISQQNWDPGRWNWNDPNLLFSTINTAFSVGIDLGNDISQLAQNNVPIQDADPNEFGHAGAAKNVNISPLDDEYPDPNDPVYKELETNTADYKAIKPTLEKTPYECSRYAGYAKDRKIYTPDQLSSLANPKKNLIGIEATDPSKLDPKEKYAIHWQANPVKAKKLAQAGIPIQHAGVYHNDFVWHFYKGQYLKTEFWVLQDRMYKVGYTIGPTFRLW